MALGYLFCGRGLVYARLLCLVLLGGCLFGGGSSGLVFWMVFGGGGVVLCGGWDCGGFLLWVLYCCFAADCCFGID